MASRLRASPRRSKRLRNSDVELRLTNRGGGIKEAVLLKQVAEKGQRVVLNSDQSAPIGAIIEQPSIANACRVYRIRVESDSAVQFERTTPEQSRHSEKVLLRKISREQGQLRDRNGC